MISLHEEAKREHDPQKSKTHRVLGKLQVINKEGSNVCVVPAIFSTIVFSIGAISYGIPG